MEADSTWIICQRDVGEGSVLFIHLSLHGWSLLTLHRLLSGFRRSFIHVQHVQNVLPFSSFSPFFTLPSFRLVHARSMNHSLQSVLLSNLTGGSGYTVVMVTGKPKQKAGHPTRKTVRGQSLSLTKGEP